MKSRSDKFNYILKKKLTKIAQIAANISFNVGFQYLIDLLESRSDKFNYILKKKLAKIAQIAVNISFNVGFRYLMVLIGLDCFIL